MKLSRVISITISLLMFAVSAHAVYKDGKPQPKGPEFAPDQILVKFRSDVTPAIINQVTKRNKVEVKKVIPGIDVYVMKFNRGMPAEEMVKRFSAEVAVEFAEPDHVAIAMDVPHDPLYSQQWGLPKIMAPGGWDIQKGSNTVIIAIVDTGIKVDHEDLQGILVPGYNAIKTTKEVLNQDANDDNGHGTHVAGIASAATNNQDSLGSYVGIAGVSWGCSLMPVKVLDENGSGFYSDVADGIIWAASHGAKAINLSLGGSFNSKTLKAAVDLAWNGGTGKIKYGDQTVIVEPTFLACAAGNSGSSSPNYPGRYDNCTAVAATDSGDQKPWWSTFGKWVDVAAPGALIVSTYFDGSYTTMSGTSMATPHVAGLAGLLFSATSPALVSKIDTDGDLKLENNEVRARIEKTCDKISGTGNYWKYGRINVYNALTRP
ncbi:MAG: peptidase S8 [Geobacter sp.]|nr:peptidase S8 [Geobacter sp.]